MIFLDANIFLRYLVYASSPQEQEMQEIASRMFEAVERGEESITTTEVVIHEVCFILGSSKQYGYPVEKVVFMVSGILNMAGFWLPRGEKQIFLDALELFKAHPKLEFSDSVIAIRSHRAGLPLATFDKALLQLPIVTPWQPEDHGQP